MLFSLKNPLNRNLSPQDLHHSRESLSESENASYVGASLLDKKPYSLPLNQKDMYRISGILDCHASDLVLAMLRGVVENHSILLVNLEGQFETWNKAWALSFYFDRAKDFRLVHLDNPEQSDFLGENLPEKVREMNEFKTTSTFLAETDQPADIATHLAKHKGIVTVTKSDQENPDQVKIATELSKDWAKHADVFILFGWHRIDPESQKEILDLRKHGNFPGTVIVEESLGEKTLGDGYTDILFQQANPISQGTFQRLELLSKGTPLNRSFTKLDSTLSNLRADQFMVHLETESKIDLIQYNRSDGLPWPPEYRPLRKRHPGT